MCIFLIIDFLSNSNLSVYIATVNYTLTTTTILLIIIYVVLLLLIILVTKEFLIISVKLNARRK